MASSADESALGSDNTVAATKTAIITKTKSPQIQPRCAPCSTDSFWPVRRRYRKTQKKPATTNQTKEIAGANWPETIDIAKDDAPPSKAMRTASPLLRPMGGNRGACGSGGGAVTASSRSKGSSRWGLPHLWQNRASSGNFAPHVQYSGTISVCHERGASASGRPSSAASCEKRIACSQ